MQNLNVNEADASDISSFKSKETSDDPPLPSDNKSEALSDTQIVKIDKVSTEVATHTRDKGDNPDKKKKNKKKHNLWWIKAIVISLVLSAFFSYISELVENADQLVIVIILLAFLILTGVLFDAIGVAVTSCDVTPIISMASRKVYGAKTALNLVKNSDTVSSVCNDIVGDIFSIISGACSAVLVVKITVSLQETWQMVVSIAISALVSAMTIGGKAFMKKIAIDNSKDFVMFVARVLAIFSKEERKIRKKEKNAKNEGKNQKQAKSKEKDKRAK